MLDLILNLNDRLGELAQTLGPGLYLLLFGYALVQTGFLFAPIVPGNIVVFAAGVVASTSPQVNIGVLIIAMVAGGFVGNFVNYFQGRRLGRSFFAPGKGRWRDPVHLEATERFFTKHGRAAMLVSPFTPFVRSIAPFVAGVARMPMATYALFGLAGVALWVVLLALLGYYLGQVPWVRDSMGPFALVVMALVTAKFIWEVRRRQRSLASPD